MSVIPIFRNKQFEGWYFWLLFSPIDGYFGDGGFSFLRQFPNVMSESALNGLEPVSVGHLLVVVVMVAVSTRIPILVVVVVVAGFQRLGSLS